MKHITNKFVLLLGVAALLPGCITTSSDPDSCSDACPTTPMPEFEVYSNLGFDDEDNQRHLGQMIRRFSAELAEHNLLVSEMLLSTVQNQDGTDTGGIRARSEPPENFEGDFCAMVWQVKEDDQVDTQLGRVRTCLVWWTPET